MIDYVEKLIFYQEEIERIDSELEFCSDRKMLSHFVKLGEIAEQIEVILDKMSEEDFQRWKSRSKKGEDNGSNNFN